MPEAVPILVVNDRADQLAALEAALSCTGLRTLPARSARAALEIARDQRIAVAILDIRMPAMDGFELAAALRASEETRALPLIFVSALEPTDAMLDRVYSLGAVDYLWSPVSSKILCAKVAVFVDLHRKNEALRRESQLIARGAGETEAVLRATQEQFQHFFELAAAGNVIIDPASRRFHRVNAKFCAITGYSAEELRNLTFADITHPDDFENDRVRFGRLLSGQVREVSTEKRYIRKTGEPVWVHVTATLLRAPDNTPLLQLSVVQDITARKQAEQELLGSRLQLRLALEAASLGTFFFDPAHQVLVASDRAKILSGLPPDVQETQDIFLRCVHPEDRPRVTQQLAQISKGTGGSHDHQIEYRVVWPDGSVHHLAAASRVMVTSQPDGTSGVKIIGTLRDVTSTREFERALQQKVTERTAALREKTEQLEGFCYTVAHDLRSPLRAISGYADIVLEDLAAQLTTEGASYVEKIKAAAHRLDLLIQDLLAYSRVTQIEIRLEDIPLQDSVDWAVQQLQWEIKSTGARIDVASPLPRVLGERSVLDQIFLNLISNALKFIPAGRTPHVEIRTSRMPNLVRIAVRDNGIGIPAGYQDRIFKVFERLQQARDFPGTGVGLAIVAKAAARLDGRVSVESRPDEGSTFWVELKPGTS